MAARQTIEDEALCAADPAALCRLCGVAQDAHQVAKRLDSFALPAGYSLVYEPSYILRGLAGLELDVVKR